MEMGRHLFDPYKEIWRDVVWFEDWYEVSTYGRVRTKERWLNNRYSGRMLKPTLLRRIEMKYGHLAVTMCVNKKQYLRYVHRLVAEAFLGEVDGYMVEFIDGDRSNVYLNNLRIRNDVERADFVHEIFIKKRKGEI